ncbi:MAG: 50S ribosomal protein L28 [Candidatus Omnitrophica bacterium]|nr:50S ribosomal protein L28 [Candidatus Omnitrophota bacterium]
MAQICEICGKGALPGNKYKRRGMVKSKGGAGSKVVGKTLRRFLPNLQSVKITQKGTVRRTKVCASCIQAGKITKA